jgi:hypothetical protein
MTKDIKRRLYSTTATIRSAAVELHWRPDREARAVLASSRPVAGYCGAGFSLR